ncbi:TolC family protein [Proteiniphilum sp. UBA5384]|uniref:TolC family protein n=1 Tax=Proteiniphilum sp. UBA5384 TaxID=1947279 RepID=UPI0025DFCB83|nr:TolC family protein [Proteiniphilum sp. UBA5384]
MDTKRLRMGFSCLLLFFVVVSLLSGANAQMLLTIDEALDIAEEHNPDLKASKLSLERYQQNLVAQRASLKSKFSLDLNPLNYSKTRRFDNRLSQWYTNEAFNTSGTFRVSQPILLTDGEISLINTFGWQDNKSTVEGRDNSNKAFSNDLYLQLTQPVFTYNRRKMEMKQIEFDYENAGIRYALQRLNTERSITNQFYAVYMAQNNLAISKDELENTQKSFEIIRNKVEADLSAREELYQAELNLDNAKSTVEERIVALENAKDQLKQSLGMPLHEEIEVTADIEVSPIAVDLNRAVQSGLSSRMEIRQREIDIELGELQMIQTKSMNEFRGDISLSVGIIGDDEKFGNIYENPTRNPRVAISFAVPIFDWGEKKARVKAQKIAQTIAKMEQENLQVDIELDVRQVWRRLENLRTQIDIAEKSVRNAELTYDINLTRYHEGDLTGMEINQFQTQLSGRKMAYAQALINYKIELLNLKILSLYDFEKDKPIVPVREL